MSMIAATLPRRLVGYTARRLGRSGSAVAVSVVLTVWLVTLALAAGHFGANVPFIGGDARPLQPARDAAGVDAAPAGEGLAAETAGSSSPQAISGSGALPPGATDPLAPALPAQLRAFWVDAFHDGIKTPAQVEQLIADAHLAGANALIVQVRRRGDAYYNRTNEPRTEDPGLPRNFDALQSTIELAHAAQPRLEVHAWIATVALWNHRLRPPLNPAHVFNQHGPNAEGEANWLSLNESGQAWDGDNYMLDPGHPGVVRYIAGVAAELTREYDLDGIHLDLIRYAGMQWGYNPVSVARYNIATSTTGSPAPHDARWQDWRRQQVTSLVRRVYVDCLAENPRIKVSAATIGWGSGPVDDRSWRATSAFRNVFQDWLGWLEEGIIDMVMPMNYDDERNAAQRVWFDQWMNWQKEHKGKRHVVAGIGLFLNQPADGLSQVQRALAPTAAGATLDGVALYSYAVTNVPPSGGTQPSTPNGEMYHALSSESSLSRAASPPFAGPALPPPMPWKDEPSAHVRGVVHAASAGFLDGATLRLEGPSSHTLRTDGDGYFGAPALPPGTYTLTLDHRTGVSYHTTVVLPAGRVTALALTLNQ